MCYLEWRVAMGDSSSTNTIKAAVNGLIDTHKVTQKGVTLSSGSVQILHINRNHWITVSTLMSTMI